jgi:hypothetical protein
MPCQCKFCRRYEEHDRAETVHAAASIKAQKEGDYETAKNEDRCRVARLTAGLRCLERCEGGQQ